MLKYDVCIFGGGPAGSAMAKRLIAFGYSVVVVEKMRYPRSHVGISLSSGVEHWLRVLDISVDKAFSARSLLLWESDEVMEKAGGWHVDRGWFDQLLLQASGARVIVGNAYPVENMCGEWDVFIEQELSFTARFLVAATGRRPLLKGRRRAVLPVTVAGYARCEVPDTFIEAGEDCWYWGGGGLGFVFADPAAVQQFGNAEAFYVDKMRRSRLMTTAGFGMIRMCTATAYVDEAPVGRNFIKIGDAVFAMDPLSAQGVQKALKTAVQGAVVVNTILKGDVAVAVRYYEEMIAAEVRKHVRWTRAFYGRQGRFESGFWKVRAGEELLVEEDQVVKMGAGDLLIVNPVAVVEKVPVMGDAFIQYEYGMRLPGHEDPLVYVDEQPVVRLVEKVDRRCVRDVVALLGVDVLRWLVYNRVIVKA